MAFSCLHVYKQYRCLETVSKLRHKQADGRRLWGPVTRYICEPGAGDKWPSVQLCLEQPASDQDPRRRKKIHLILLTYQLLLTPGNPYSVAEARDKDSCPLE
jgi:hypothetical protein